MNMNCHAYFLSLLDSFHFDDKGKTIDAIHDNFGLLGQNKASGVNARRVKQDFYDDEGNVRSYFGWVVSYDALSGLYTIKYDDGVGCEEMLEVDVEKIIIEE